MVGPFLETSENISTLTEEQVEQLGKAQFADENLRKIANNSGVYYQPEISMALQRVIQRAAIHVQSAGKKRISGVNLLASIFEEKESFALYTLEKRGVTKYDVLKVISHNLTYDENLLEDHSFVEDESADKKNIKSKKYKFLELYTEDLNASAKAAQIDPVIGRVDEIARIVQILCRRRKNNPLLVGEAGVGKTAIAEGLALNIVNENVPDVIKGLQLFALDWYF